MEFDDTHREAFSRDGYAVVEGFLHPDEVATLRARIRTLLDGFDPDTHPQVLFETGTGDRHIGDTYYLESGTKARYFLEEAAIEDGRLTVPAHLAVNKIGHGLHMVDPVFDQVTRSPRISEIAHSLGFRDPRVHQSMVICKQPGVGGEVPWHQDSTFIYTEPHSACGFWFALEDCTVDNGCLEAVPGSHRTTPISRRFVRAAQGGTEMVDIPPTFSLYPLPGDEREPPQDDSSSVPIEVPAGSLVLIHGQLCHRSAHNHSDKSRWIYTFHIVEGGFTYDERNWLQKPSDAGFAPL